MQSDDPKGKKNQAVGGVGAVQEMFRHMDAEHQKKLLENIAKQDPKLAEEIKKGILRFEDLINLKPEEMQLVYRMVSEDQWLLALRGASPELTDGILKNVSQRAAERMREDLATQQPRKRTDVEEARQAIVTTLSDLIASGKVSRPIESSETDSEDEYV